MIPTQDVVKMAIKADLEFSSIKQAGIVSVAELDEFASLIEAATLDRAAERAQEVIHRRWMAGADRSGDAEAVRQAVLHLKNK